MQVLVAQQPAVRVARLESFRPTVLTSQMPTVVATGTVTVIDCQNSWLDLRAWPPGPLVRATIVMLRCHLLMSDQPPHTWQTWIFDTTTHFPCNVRLCMPLHIQLSFCSSYVQICIHQFQ